MRNNERGRRQERGSPENKEKQEEEEEEEGANKDGETLRNRSRSG